MLAALVETPLLGLSDLIRPNPSKKTGYWLLVAGCWLLVAGEGALQNAMARSKVGETSEESR
jgi:hypothetical protein